jgi:hypothetical protein
MDSDITENGLAMPIRGYTIFMKKPINITAATLKPTEYRSDSIALIPCTFRILRIRVPGMYVR